ncbi:NAD(P)H-dependent flavin oxidoreductase [Neobacillus sp. D3-1R]|uniref:NAD(P)H-dependent flavin oxidoreductase n=1 Tax=Neobacillus sp. D3-1R TaxID=3445778 RepID=UPI003F9F31D9
MLKNRLTELLRIKYPIIQAPMAGGVTTSDLVAEASNHGGLGSIGAGYLSPVQLRNQIHELKTKTTNPFSVNLFVPPNVINMKENEIIKANQLLQPIREQFQLSDVTSDIPNLADIMKTFEEQIKVVIEEEVPICSFTFGIPTTEIIMELKQYNTILIGTATTVTEAIELEKVGMDVIVVQGCEAGGHRGNFIKSGEESLIGLMSLIPQVVDQISIPVIAAGGIMDGRGLMGSLCLGAKGVQMGTAFLTCEESGAHRLHKEAILQSNEEQAVLTRAFSGKWARGIHNKFISEMKDYEEQFPEFPVQNTLTQSIRKAASKQYNKEYMSLWAGQSARLARNETVESLITRVIKEASKIIEETKAW